MTGLGPFQDDMRRSKTHPPRISVNLPICANPLCDRHAGITSGRYCCTGCRTAHEYRYEIHEAGLLGHSTTCNALADEPEEP